MDDMHSKYFVNGTIKNDLLALSKTVSIFNFILQKDIAKFNTRNLCSRPNNNEKFTYLSESTVFSNAFSAFQLVDLDLAVSYIKFIA